MGGGNSIAFKSPDGVVSIRQFRVPANGETSKVKVSDNLEAEVSTSINMRSARGEFRIDVRDPKRQYQYDNYQLAFGPNTANPTTDGAIKELKDRLSSMIESAMKKQRNS